MTVSQAAITDAVARLEAGAIVCLPTETTYGLAVDIGNRAALEALSVLKERAPESPFGLIAGDVEQAVKLAAVWPPLAGKLAERYWPGPLTVVVPAAAGLAAEIVGPPALDNWGSASGGVGVRVSSHPVARALAHGLGRAITATSANPKGKPPALDIATARAYFGDAVWYLDDGPAPAEPASTVVAIAVDGRARVLRPGPIELFGDLSGDATSSPTGDRQP